METRSERNEKYYINQYIQTDQNSRSKNNYQHNYTTSNIKENEIDSKLIQNNNMNSRNYSRNKKDKRTIDNKNSLSVPKNKNANSPIRSNYNENYEKKNNNNIITNKTQWNYNQIQKDNNFKQKSAKKNKKINVMDADFNLSFRIRKTSPNTINDTTMQIMNPGMNLNSNVSYKKLVKLSKEEKDNQLVYAIQKLSNQLNQLLIKMNKKDKYYNNEKILNNEISTNNDNIYRLLGEITSITDNLENNYNKELVELKENQIYQNERYKCKNLDKYFKINNKNEDSTNNETISFIFKNKNFPISKKMDYNNINNNISNNFMNEKELNNLKEEINKYKKMCLNLKKSNDILNNNYIKIKNDYIKEKNNFYNEIKKKNEEIKYYKDQYKDLNNQLYSYKIESKESLNKLLKENSELNKKVFTLQSNLYDKINEIDELNNRINMNKIDIKNSSEINSIKKSNNTIQSKSQDCKNLENQLCFSSEQQQDIYQEFINLRKNIIKNNNS